MKSRDQTSVLLYVDQGPNGEAAAADRYALFYRNGVFPNCGPEGDACRHWWSNVPQGFSCGKGAAGPDNFDIFVPVDCFEIIVKVVKDEDCDEVPGNDCFDFPNWG